VNRSSSGLDPLPQRDYELISMQTIPADWWEIKSNHSGYPHRPQPSLLRLI
jgi:hypothetical protein